MAASTRHHPFHNTLQRVWDTGTLDWIPMTQPGGGTGGGGDASAANQVTGNASLAAIKLDVDKIPSQGQALAGASLPVVLTAAQVTTLTPPAALTGYALEAGHLAAIDTATARIPALGQALAAASVPVILPAATVVTLTPPAAITGFALEAGHLATIDTKIPALGQALAAASVPIVLTAAQLTTLTPPAALTTLPVTNTGTFAVQATATLAAETTKVIGTVNVAAGQTIAVTSAGLTNLDVALSTRLKPADTLAGVTTVAAVTAITNALPAGTNVIGHVIHDTGSTTVVTGNVTVVQPTGTALHAVLDTTSTTAVTQATGTNLHMVVDSGTITTVSTVTAVTAITNALPTGTNTLGSVKLTDGTTTAKVTVANAQPASTDGAVLVNAIDTFAGTALASASRGVATVNTDIVNYNGKGIRVWQDLTVLGASSVCTFTIQEKDPVSGKFVTLLASAATGAGINATGTAKLTVYPGLTAAANSVASDVVPMNIRIVSTVATAASTFSIGYSLIP